MTKTDEICERAERTKRRLDSMLEQFAVDRLKQQTNATVALNPMDELLDDLQLLASSAIVDEIKDVAMRPTLKTFARKFEQLDAAIAGGLMLPSQWQRKPKGSKR